MRLEELKFALVEQFFKVSDNGVKVDQLFDVFVSLGKHLKADVTTLADKGAGGNTSADPSKAFKMFTNGKTALLSIIEEPGVGASDMAIFAAVRVGKAVYMIDLTAEGKHEKKGDLAAVKQALRQAKNLNDDAYFSIVNQD